MGPAVKSTSSSARSAGASSSGHTVLPEGSTPHVAGVSPVTAGKSMATSSSNVPPSDPIWNSRTHLPIAPARAHVDPISFDDGSTSSQGLTPVQFSAYPENFPRSFC